MSPLVKQDLARLDKDGESRRRAMNSVMQYVENLDPGSLPRFLAQVSETREQGVSRSYAVSLYEELARVHGKLIIPHIPRVMATVIRSLSSSGGSPQLHQACAKVVSAVARHSVEDVSPAQADEILRELCDPLLSVLAGTLEPLAAGAAVCLQALVESEKWKYASDEIVKEACLRTSVALGEMLTHTVAHMQLARSLATTNPSFFDRYGVVLLRSGSEVIRQTSGTWQQRACAARLLQAVLPIVDKATLASEFEHVVHALDDCKHDRMAHVRMAASEALKAAKVLSSHHHRDRSDGVSCDFRPPSGGSSCSGQVGKQGRSSATAPGFSISHSSLLGEEIGSEQQSSDIVASSAVMSKFRGIRSYSSLENAAITAYGKQKGVDILVEEISSNGTTGEIELETNMDSDQGLPNQESRYNQVGGEHNENFDLVSSNRFSHRQTLLTGPTRKSACELEGSASDSGDQSVRAHSHNLDQCLHAASGVFVGNDYKDSLDVLSERQSRHSSLLHWRSLADISSPQKQRAFVTAEDFLPFSTPRRLVRSLQSNLASPLGSGPSRDKVAKSLRDGVDMSDLETNSEARWSVRDSPIASDDSLKTDSEEDREQTGNICKNMVINSSSKTCSAELAEKVVRTEGCEVVSSAVANAAESLSPMGTSKSLEPKCLTEDAEALNDWKVDDVCVSSVGEVYEGRLPSIVGEQYPSQFICSAKASKGAGSFEGGDYLIRDVQDIDTILTREFQSDRTIWLPLKRFRHFFRPICGKLLSVRAGIEGVLTGFLLFIFAVPFAMLMSKILWSHLDRPGLIPT